MKREVGQIPWGSLCLKGMIHIIAFTVLACIFCKVSSAVTFVLVILFLSHLSFTMELYVAYVQYPGGLPSRHCPDPSLLSFRWLLHHVHSDQALGVYWCKMCHQLCWSVTSNEIRDTFYSIHYGRMFKKQWWHIFFFKKMRLYHVKES